MFRRQTDDADSQELAANARYEQKDVRGRGWIVGVGASFNEAAWRLQPIWDRLWRWSRLRCDTMVVDAEDEALAWRDRWEGGGVGRRHRTDAHLTLPMDAHKRQSVAMRVGGPTDRGSRKTTVQMALTMQLCCREPWAACSQP